MKRLVLVVLVGLVACKKSGPSDSELDAKLVELEGKLATVADQIDKLNVAVNPEKPNPPMVFETRDDGRGSYNSDFISYEGLRGKKPAFVAAPSDSLPYALEGDRKQLARAIPVRYVVVLKSTFTEPRAIDATTFVAGAVEITGFVADLTGPKIIGTFSLYVDAPSTVTYTTENVGSGAAAEVVGDVIAKGKLDSSLRAHMYARSKEAVEKALAANFGATFNQ